MHKTFSITTLVLLAFPAMPARAQDSARQAAAAAKAEPAAVPLAPVTVLRPDTVSLTEIHTRLLRLEQRQPDPTAEIIKWIVVGIVGISFSAAWHLVRRTEKAERSETTLRELTKEALKDPSRSAEIKNTLDEQLQRFERAAQRITDASSNADAALGLINGRLSLASERMSAIQQQLDNRAHEAPSRVQARSNG